MIFLAVMLAAMPIEEAEHALASGRIEQSGKMIDNLAAQGAKGERFDRLRAGQALASGRFVDALGRYGALATTKGHAQDFEGAAIAAYRAGRPADAAKWLDWATSRTGASWRSYNLCAVMADERSDFATADTCYDKADAIQPGRGEIANNRGWSLMLRGDWAGAKQAFERALGINPADRMARSNLDLAIAAMASELPARREGEEDEAYGRRLNDAGVMAQAVGHAERARAAFATSLEMRSRWSAIAAANLASAGAR